MILGLILAMRDAAYRNTVRIEADTFSPGSDRASARSEFRYSIDSHIIHTCGIVVLWLSLRMSYPARRAKSDPFILIGLYSPYQTHYRQDHSPKIIKLWRFSQHRSETP